MCIGSFWKLTIQGPFVLILISESVSGRLFLFINLSKYFWMNESCFDSKMKYGPIIWKIWVSWMSPCKKQIKTNRIEGMDSIRASPNFPIILVAQMQSSAHEAVNFPTQNCRETVRTYNLDLQKLYYLFLLKLSLSMSAMSLMARTPFIVVKPWEIEKWHLTPLYLMFSD